MNKLLIFWCVEIRANDYNRRIHQNLIHLPPPILRTYYVVAARRLPPSSRSPPWTPSLLRCHALPALLRAWAASRRGCWVPPLLSCPCVIVGLCSPTTTTRPLCAAAMPPVLTLPPRPCTPAVPRVSRRRMPACAAARESRLHHRVAAMCTPPPGRHARVAVPSDKKL